MDNFSITLNKVLKSMGFSKNAMAPTSKVFSLAVNILIIAIRIKI